LRLGMLQITIRSFYWRTSALRIPDPDPGFARNLGNSDLFYRPGWLEAVGHGLDIPALVDLAVPALGEDHHGEKGKE